jgi:hypothetical protein
VAKASTWNMGARIEQAAIWVGVPRTLRTPCSFSQRLRVSPDYVHSASTGPDANTQPGYKLYWGIISTAGAESADPQQGIHMNAVADVRRPDSVFHQVERQHSAGPIRLRKHPRDERTDVSQRGSGSLLITLMSWPIASLSERATSIERSATPALHRYPSVPAPA